MSAPPDDRPHSTLARRVAFHETDAMGIVHHANYLRYLEDSRILLLDEHDRPYRWYVDAGLHFAVRRVEIDYRRSAGFDDRLDVDVWVDAARGAALGAVGGAIGGNAGRGAAIGAGSRNGASPRTSPK